MPPDWYVLPVLYTAAAFCLITVGWWLHDWWHEHFPAPDATTMLPMPGYPGVDSTADAPDEDEDAVHATWARLRESYKGENS